MSPLRCDIRFKGIPTPHDRKRFAEGSIRANPARLTPPGPRQGKRLARSRKPGCPGGGTDPTRSFRTAGTSALRSRPAMSPLEMGGLTTGTNGRVKSRKGAQALFLELPKSGRGLLPNTGRTSGKTFPVTPRARAEATTPRTEDNAHMLTSHFPRRRPAPPPAPRSPGRRDRKTGLTLSEMEFLSPMAGARKSGATVPKLDQEPHHPGNGHGHPGEGDFRSLGSGFPPEPRPDGKAEGYGHGDGSRLASSRAMRARVAASDPPTWPGGILATL